MFWINGPFGLVSLALIVFLFPENARKNQRGIDYRGAVLMMSGAAMLLLGFSTGSWRLITIGAAVLGIFLMVERSAADPLIPLSFFRDRLISLGMLIMFLVGFAMYGAVSLVPFFAQNVLGIEVSRAGTILTPAMLAMIVSSIGAGFLVGKLPIKGMLLTGTALVAVGFFLLFTLDPNSSLLVVYLDMIVIGLGLGPVNPVLLIAIQRHAGYEDRGIATSMLEFVTTIGGSVGVTVMNAVMNAEAGVNIENVWVDAGLLGKALSSAFVVGTLVTAAAVCISFWVGGGKHGTAADSARISVDTL